MRKQKLKDFKIGRLDRCPECGATGSYDLLSQKSLVAIQKFRAFLKANPTLDHFASGTFPDLKSAINDMEAVIGKTL